MKNLTKFGIVYMIILLSNIIFTIVPSFSWFNLIASIFMIVTILMEYFGFFKKCLIFKK